MGISFAAILHRPAEVSDEALSHGIAVAVAGFDVPAPHVLVAPIPGFAGWSAAFYRSGKSDHTAYEEVEHACELFEDELPPGLAIRDAAGESGARDAIVYTLIYDDEQLEDDAWRFDESGFERRFVREGDDGPVAGHETLDDAREEPISIDVPDGASESTEAALAVRAIAPHRGSAFLAAELGGPVLRELIGALFAADRRVDAHLVDPRPEAIAREACALNRVLRRTDGRGAFVPIARDGVDPPPSFLAFARAYDWADPADPGDLYRELAIGAIEGTLRFLRAADLGGLERETSLAAAAKRRLFPIAELTRGGLGGSAKRGALIALEADGEHLILVESTGRARAAGPTFGELLRYLTLGWKSRSEIEEDLIGALMLRARLRAEADAERGTMRHGL